MKPVVTIVGRPNVGKSTLFNRLIRGRKALVDDLPGVTRDRIYGEVNWDKHYFTLIDTGGFEPHSGDRLLSRIGDQVKLAIEEGGAIIFLLDGREGVVSTDRDIARLLRKSGKPIFTAINKLDGYQEGVTSLKWEGMLQEFYQLGFEKLYPISAQHNLGVEEMVEDILGLLPSYKEEKGEGVSIAVVGRPNVGKSTLINKILGYERLLCDEAPGTTRDAIDTLFERGGKRYLFIDTAGIRRRSRRQGRLEKYSVGKALGSIARAEIVLLLIDGPEGIVTQDAWIASYATERGRGIIILINKWDLIPKSDNIREKYVRYIESQLRFIDFSPILFVSALKGEGLKNIFPAIDKIEGQLQAKIATAKLNNFLKKAYSQHPPSPYQGREVKLNYITQVAILPPTFLIFTNHPSGITEQYVRYLSHQARRSLNLPNIPVKFIFREKTSKNPCPSTRSPSHDALSTK